VPSPELLAPEDDPDPVADDADDEAEVSDLVVGVAESPELLLVDDDFARLSVL
jgi:hypothetical protein